MRRAVLLAWSILVIWSGSLYLRAALDPPPGRVFAGTFHWIDDFYNYASYVQQAEDGAFLFVNKQALPSDARPELVNLEWWMVGQISRLAGQRPFLAYRIFGVLVTLALVAAVDRWLEAVGLPESHRLPALLLVSFGGGLGGVLFEWTDTPINRCLDLAVGLFPFLGVFANPHFVAGTTLLLWSLWAFTRLTGLQGAAVGAGLGTMLGLVRPYDLVLVGATRLVGIALTAPPRHWLREALPLAGLVPVLIYNLWVFFVSRQFSGFRVGPAFPLWRDLAPALGPAALLALWTLRRPARNPAERVARVHLWAWTGLALAASAARPGAFSVQFLVGAGVPLLVLGSLALAGRAPAWTTVAAVVFSGSAFAATRIALRDDPNWFVPRERMAAGMALRRICSHGDLVLSPPDIGLYAIGLSRCHAFLSHESSAHHAPRAAEARSFYGSWPAEVRSAWLDRMGVTHLVLPGDAGPQPTAWLGSGTPFRLAARIGHPTQLGVYVRSWPRAPVP